MNTAGAIAERIRTGQVSTQVFWIAHASLTGHPALSMPIGCTREGLPVGGQVIGPWHEDDTAITFAELLAG